MFFFLLLQFLFSNMNILVCFVKVLWCFPSHSCEVGIVVDDVGISINVSIYEG